MKLEIPKELIILDSLTTEDSTETLLRIEGGKNNFLLFRYTPCTSNANASSCEFAEPPPIAFSYFSPDGGKPKFDTSSTMESIGAVPFKAFKTQITYDQNLSVEHIVYSKSFSNYLLSINLSYSEKEMGNKLIQVIRSAKFID
ncbi:hypothetical protein [Ferruginibacter sp. SUN106]|uniref:hypothetical protein n=1 Tax=Ferruginibacter sp. SUN106 TaxID=2978348 RepID=UPI003D363008